MGRPLQSIIPARFLSLSAHLAVIIMAMDDRDGNVRACLPLQYTTGQYDSKDNGLIAGLSFSIVFLAVEFFGFLFGFSMFNVALSLLSIALHASGAVAVLFFRVNDWDCDRFWAIFATCSVVPVILEILVIVFMIKYKR